MDVLFRVDRLHLTAAFGELEVLPEDLDFFGRYVFVVGLDLRVAPEEGSFLSFRKARGHAGPGKVKNLGAGL